MARTFVTIFPICENVHLTKDLGQIPYFLHRKFGYDSKIVCYRNSSDYSNIEGEVKGLKLEFIKDTGRISFLEKSVLAYIYKNAKQIDVLNLYIFSKYTFVYGILYKMLNPKGFLFLKLDGYNETFAEGQTVRHSIKKGKDRIFKRLENMFLRRVDLVTIENSTGEMLVKRMYPQINDKVMYLPVGVNDLFLKEAFPARKSFSQKENIILTVGRVGEPIKNHEMLLRALTGIGLEDWRMVFVGPVKPGFMDYYDEWIKAYPQLKSRITFAGEITRRSEVYEWYNRSKVFCMTSWKESFCHSIGEALYFGNYIFGTDGIVSMTDLTDHERYGRILKADDDAALAAGLQQMIGHPETLEALCPQIMNYSDRSFTWSNIIGKVHKRIEEKQA